MLLVHAWAARSDSFAIFSRPTTIRGSGGGRTTSPRSRSIVDVLLLLSPNGYFCFCGMLMVATA